MIQLFTNGKLVDYGTKPDVGFYVRLGYDVKVLNAEETKEWRHMMKIKAIWKNLPMVLRKRIQFLVNNQKLTWIDRYHTMLRVLHTIIRRVKSFTMLRAIHKKKQSFIDRLMTVS